jgi:hypothetical protein
MAATLRIGPVEDLVPARKLRVIGVGQALGNNALQVGIDHRPIERPPFADDRPLLRRLPGGLGQGCARRAGSGGCRADERWPRFWTLKAPSFNSAPMLQRSGRVAGLIEPCLPSLAKTPPSGPDWLHEIKHDGFRILARRDAAGVRLYTRNGNDFSKRFPLVVAAIAALPARSCLIDGEVIVTAIAKISFFIWKSATPTLRCRA